MTQTETATTFTPGPWRLEQPDKWPYDLTVYAASGEAVVSQRRWAHSSTHKSLSDCLDAVGFPAAEWVGIKTKLSEQIANAHLIAAAPLLYEACQLAVVNEVAVDGLRGSGMVDDAEIKALRAIAKSATAAIAAATGEAQ